MVYRMDNSHSGETIEAQADRLEFRTVRVTDERGMERAVKCFVYDEEGNRVVWPANSGRPEESTSSDKRLSPVARCGGGPLGDHNEEQQKGGTAAS